MTRCQHFQHWCCRVALLAEAVMVGMGGLAPQNLSPTTARLSPENAGPMMPRIVGSDASVVAAVGAFFGSPSLSDVTSWILNLAPLDALYVSTASWAPWRSLMPSWAFGPDRAPMKP